MYLDTKLVSRGKDSNRKRKSLEYGFCVSGLGIWVKGTAMHRTRGHSFHGGWQVSFLSFKCTCNSQGREPRWTDTAAAQQGD